MSNRNIDVDKNTLSFQEIKSSDTISQFMEKVNNNFKNINFNNAGPKGDDGDEGPQGAPTKPKVPIHAWVKGEQYEIENKIGEDFFEVTGYEGKVDLSDIKYEEGHLIVLDNGHAYILELNEGILKPKYIMAIQSVDPTIKIDGKTAYLHIAFTNDINNKDSFITYNKLKESKKSISSYLYIGVISSTDEVYEEAPELPSAYTWLRFKSDDCIASLSTPIVHLLVGEDNSCIQNTQSISTDVYLHHNFSEVAKENFTITIPSNLPHFSINSSKITFNPIITEGNENKVFKFDNNTHFKVPISISYKLDDSSSEYKTTIDWTLTPIKSIKDAEVFVDKKVVNISENVTHNLKVGYYLISNGNKTFIDEFNDDNEYNIILTNEVKNKYNTSVSISDWSQAPYDFSNNNKCYVVLVDSNGYTVDYTVVTTVKNGDTPTIKQNTDKNYYWAINENFIEVGDDKQLIRANGIDGSSIHLELDKDHIILPYNINSDNIHPSYKNNIIFNCYLYNNNKIINDDVTNSFTLSTLDNSKTIYSNDGKFDIKIDSFIEFIKNDVENKINFENNINEFIVKIEYNDEEYTKTLLVELKETPYRVTFDKNILMRYTNGNIKDTVLSGSIEYFNKIWQFETNEIIKIKASWGYNNNEHNYVVNVNTDDTNKTGQFEFNFTGTYKISTDINYIYIKAYTIFNDDYINNTEPLTLIYEGTIPIVNDGQKSNELVTVKKGENNVTIKEDTIVLGNPEGNNNIIQISLSDQPSNIQFNTKINDGGIEINSIKNDDKDILLKISDEGICMTVNDFGLQITKNGIEKIGGTKLTINHISVPDGNIISANNIKVPSGNINIKDFKKILDNEILNLSLYNFNKIWTIHDKVIDENTNETFKFNENDIIVGEYVKKTFNVVFRDYMREEIKSESKTVYANSNITLPTLPYRGCEIETKSDDFPATFESVGWLDSDSEQGDILLESNNYKVNRNLNLNATYKYSHRIKWTSNEDTGKNLTDVLKTIKDTGNGYKAYVISQPYHKKGETTWYCTQENNLNACNGTDIYMNNISQQFLFIPVEQTYFYIYNIALKKYITSECKLSDEPSDALRFCNTGKYEDTFMLQFINSNEIINVNGESNISIDNHNTKDGGNSCEIRDTNNTYFSVNIYICPSNGPYEEDGTTLKNDVVFFKTIYIKGQTPIGSKTDLISSLNLPIEQYDIYTGGNITYDESENIINNDKVYYLYIKR